MSVATALIARLRAAGLSVATAESLTGGLVCSALIDVPGASAVVRGGIVAYAAAAKIDVLGVAPELIAERGTVDEQVAAVMAEQARIRFGADIAVSTTGNAGPEPSEGKPVGLVWLAVADDAGIHTRRIDFSGDRRAIRVGAVSAALSALAARVE